MSEDVEVRYTSQVFYIRLSDGSKAFLRYEVNGNYIKLIATYTPEQHRGKGYAKLLVDKAVEVARERGLKIIPICSYAVYYFIKNPELRSLLAEPYNSMGDEELKKLYEERLKEERGKDSVSS